ncbi:MAG: hypothetical protein U1E76_22610 [Planctomycetota bacterium]
MQSKIKNGAVIAAECCYGAELYDPADSGGQAGICSTYLLDGAYGFFGSTTIAYGPSEGNGQADLICQFFLEAVRNGASLGRAALEARHRFAALYSHLDPTDLKTIAQFYLLGDPAVQPVGEVPHALARARCSGARSRVPPVRRARSRSGASASRAPARTCASRSAQRKRRRCACQRTWRVRRGRGARVGSARAGPRLVPGGIPAGGVERCDADFAAARRQRAVHVLVGKVASADHVRRVVVLAATVERGRIVHLRRVHSR